MAADSENLRAHGEVTADGGVTVTFGTAQTLPYQLDLEIVKGAEWSLSVMLRNPDASPADLSSGYTAAFTVRYEEGDSSTLLALTDSDGITLADGTAGANIKLKRTGTQTAALSWVQARYALSVTNTGTSKVTPVLEGFVRLMKAASQ